MNLLKTLAVGSKKREPSGPLTGRTLRLESFTVRIEALIGEGGFASIYRAVEVSSQAVFAVKHFRLSGDPEAERDVGAEVAVMRALHGCPHTLAARAFALGPDDAFVLLDMCSGTLASAVAARGSGSGGFPEGEALAAFLPVAQAVAAMHALDPPLAHRDVKAENVLRHPDGRWVLCDFGSATDEQRVYESLGEIAAEEERVRRQTTPAYRAPELWDLYAREFVGLPVDIWSLGCLLYLLAYGRLPFDGDAKLQILNGVYRLPGGCTAAMEALIKDMLVVDPRGRITAAEVVARAQGAAAAEDGWQLLPATARAELQLRGEQRQEEHPPPPPQRQQRRQPERQQPPLWLPHEEQAVGMRVGGEGKVGGMQDWGREFEVAAAASSAAAQRAGSAVGSESEGGSRTGSRQAEAIEADGWATFGSVHSTPQKAPAPPEPTKAAVAAPAVEASVVAPPATVLQPAAAVLARPDPAATVASSPVGDDAPARATPAALPHADSPRLERADVEQHCRVLEELLEERVREVALLRAEADAARRASRAEVAALREEAAALRGRLGRRDAELATLRQRGAEEAEALRGQVTALRDQVLEAQAEAERARQRLSAHSAGLAPALHSGSRPGSRLAGAGSPESIASFPLTLDASPTKEAAQERGMMPGSPMRRQTAPAPLRAVSPTKQSSGRNSREVAFSDLNPLA